MKKKCLLLSYGPVPVPEQDKVEGGGLRIWGLAKGILAQELDVDVAVAYKRDYVKQDPTEEYEGVSVTTWTSSEIKNLISSYDTIIVSYCMGELSNEVAAHIGSHQQLVLDCYVPAYIEISARQSDNVETEYRSFQHEVKNWDKVLRRGDLFLCANDNQKRYYQGVLSAIGRINPVTYGDDMVLVVPYGVYRDRPTAQAKPITDILKTTKEQDYRKILWFGAIYPWFDLKHLLNAVEILNKDVPTKLVIVGAKNPFNNHPDFVARYEETMAFIADSAAHTKNTIVQEWIDFNDRANWYLDSDLVIMINKLGEENELSWRTRLVDYVWADLPILTNGGDPLSEKLLANNAAALFDDSSAQSIAKQLKSLLADTDKLRTMKKNIATVRNDLYWDKVTTSLTKHIATHRKAKDFEQFGLAEYDESAPNAGAAGLARRVIGKARKVPAYYKKHGIRTTYYTARTTLLNQRKRLGINPADGPSRIVFVSHQFDMTGAPLVLIDLLRDFRKLHRDLPAVFHTFLPVRNENIHEVNKIGVKPLIHASRDIALTYHKGDVVVLNTVAYSETFKQGLFNDLLSGRVKHLHWYVHEDEPELLFSSREKAEIKELLKRGLLTIYIPAQRATANYQNFFQDIEHIKVQYYRLNLPDDAQATKSANDFDELKFILPGMVGDGRKGQLPLFYAFAAFKQEYFDKNPNLYRNFTLTYVGMMDDFFSRQLRKHETAVLGSHFRHFKQLNREQTLALIKESNITLCYSMRECLPIFVFEGMNAGHPILRNDCSGVEEQLIEGSQGNGLALSSDDFYQTVKAIERVLSKEKTSNKELARMSKVSKGIVTKYSAMDFADIIADTVKTYSQ